jgi:hypothetical protein
MGFWKVAFLVCFDRCPTTFDTRLYSTYVCLDSEAEDPVRRPAVIGAGMDGWDGWMGWMDGWDGMGWMERPERAGSGPVVGGVSHMAG